MIYKLDLFNNNNFNNANPASMDPLNSDNLSHSSNSFFAEERVVWQGSPEGARADSIPQIDKEKEKEEARKTARDIAREKAWQVKIPIEDPNVFKLAMEEQQRQASNLEVHYRSSTIKEFSTKMLKSSTDRDIQMSDFFWDNRKMYSDFMIQGHISNGHIIQNAFEAIGKNAATFLSPNTMMYSDLDELLEGALQKKELTYYKDFPYTDNEGNLEPVDSPLEGLIRSHEYNSRQASILQDGIDYYKFSLTTELTPQEKTTAQNELEKLLADLQIIQKKLNREETLLHSLATIYNEVPKSQPKKAETLSEDYVKEIKISDQLIKELNSSYPNDHLDFPSNNDKFSNKDEWFIAVAIMQTVYGMTMSQLQIEGYIQVENDFNHLKNEGEVKNQLTIVKWGPLKNMIASALITFNFLKIGYIGNLTEAVKNIKDNKQFPALISFIRENRIQQMTGSEHQEENNNLHIHNFLATLFPDTIGAVTATGLNESFSQVEIAANRHNRIDLTKSRYDKSKHDIVRSNLADYISDPTITTYILNKIKTSKDGANEYSAEALATVLNDLIRKSIPRLTLIGPKGLLDKAEILKVKKIKKDDILSGKGYDTVYQLPDIIRAGIQMETLEGNISLAEKAKDNYQKLLEQFKGVFPGLEGPSLNEAVSAMLNLDLSNIANGDINVGIGATYSFYRSDDGKVAIYAGGGASVGTNGFTPFGTVGVSYADGRFKFDFRTEASTLGTVGVATSVEFEISEILNMQLTARAFVGTITGGEVTVALREDASESVTRSTKEFLTEQKIPLSIDDLNLILENPYPTSETKDKLSQIAKKIGAIKEVAKEAYLINSEISEEAYQLTFLTMYANHIKRVGTNRNGQWFLGGGLAFGIASVAGAPPVPYIRPLISVQKASEKIYYTTHIAGAPRPVLNEAQKAEIENSLLKISSKIETPTTIVYEGGMTIVDGQGNRKAVAISQVPELGISSADAVKGLNTLEENLGIHFNILPGTNPPQIYFSINDISDKNLTNQLFNVMADPASGIEIYEIDHNKIGIKFLDGTYLPPSNLVITRTQNYLSNGHLANLTDICFTTRPVSSEQVKLSPYTEKIITVSGTETAERTNQNFVPISEQKKMDLTIMKGAYRPSLEFNQEQIAAGESLLEAIKANDQEQNPEVNNRMQQQEEAVDILLEDKVFFESLRRITTSITDLNTLELTASLQVKNLIENFAEQKGIDSLKRITDSELLYLQSILIPATYLKLGNLPPRKRQKEVLKVIGIFESFFEQAFTRPDLAQKYTPDQKQEIKKILIENQRQKIESADVNDLSKNTEKFLDPGFLLLTTASVRGSAKGLRQLRMAQGSQGVPIFTEKTVLNPEQPAEKLVLSFLQDLTDPIPDNISANRELNEANLRQLFNSETFLQLLNTQFKYKGKNVPIISAIFPNPKDINMIQQIYEQGKFPTSLDISDLAKLEHLIKIVQEIRNPQAQAVHIRPYEDSTRILGDFGLQLEGQIMFIESCGNYTIASRQTIQANLKRSDSQQAKAFTFTEGLIDHYDFSLIGGTAGVTVGGGSKSGGGGAKPRKSGGQGL